MAEAARDGKTKKKFVPIIEEAPPPTPAIHGRGASWSPANRFEKLHVDLGDVDVVQIDPNAENEERPRRETQFFRDGTKTIIARNNSSTLFAPETSINSSSRRPGARLHLLPFRAADP